MENHFSLQGKTILVTGSSSGIGRGIAVLIAKMGAQVVLTGRNIERLHETYDRLDGEGHRIISADLTKQNDIQKLVESMPLLDGVVHCAGIGSRILCKMLEFEDISYVMQINFEAPVILQAELLREKKINRNGSVVFIASAAATMPSVGNAVYSASKAALIAYAKCLSLELASRNIRVNCISPAMVWTDLALVGATEEELREAEKNYPLRRYGRPEDIAHMAVYLLGDNAGWVTGSNFEITGGTLVL